MSKRPSWDEYFIEIMHSVAKRATCDRGKSGCVIVKDKQILTTGYVGAPVGLQHCDEVGHLFKTVYDSEGNKKQHCVRTTHAEQNALMQAAKKGTPVEGATVYCSMTPCRDCAKLIINAGIKRVVAEKRYHADSDSLDFFEKAGVKVDILDDKVVKYKGQ
ncbi:cell division protein DedD [Candidatus Woesearchaeota archaeon]|nr:cell division protein DedD [Candidatus Woesearchaeota archaeon]